VQEKSSRINSCPFAWNEEKTLVYWAFLAKKEWQLECRQL
jgi:hypothetical protein